MPNGWVKYFTDGQEELGFDEIVESGRASWSRGKLDHMEGAGVFLDDRSIRIFGSGDYWQADLLETSVGVNKPSKRIGKSVFRKIKATDHHLCFESSGYDTIIYVEEGVLPKCPHKVPVRPQWIGMWLEVQILENKQMLWRLVDR